MTTPRPRDLTTPEAQRLLEGLRELPDATDPAALTRFRRAHPWADAALVAGLATQVRLQRRALPRLGPCAHDLILDEEALQQATRTMVANYRARAMAHQLGLVQVAGTEIADIGCGLGLDARALAEAGFRVLAIERDPWRAEAAEINLAPYSDRARVLCADATALDPQVLATCAAAYVDPARRATGAPRRADGGRARAVTSPESWSPPWPWVLTLAQRMPVIVKAAPGFDSRHAPTDADIEWIDQAGETLETTVWMRWGQGAQRPAELRATVVDAEQSVSITRPRDSAPRQGPSTSTIRTWLLEPSPAVVRAGLVGAFAEDSGAARLDGGSWLTADAPAGAPLARAWRVLAEVPSAARELRDWLRPYGAVTWKTSDTRASAADWDRRVSHRPARDGSAVTIIVTAQGRAVAVERAVA